MGNNDKTIKLKKLGLIINELLLNIQKEIKLDELVLKEDDYWAIDPVQKYSFSDSPSVFGVGKLWDDLEFLENALERDSEISPAMICHVVPLLAYLERVVNKGDD